MSAPVLVTGGTGTLGTHVVPRLRAAGHEVRVLSRTSRPASEPGVSHVVGDLDSGGGLAAALDGVDVVLHLAGAPKGDQAKAETLVRAASSAGSPHLVFISVVGADRVPMRGRVDRAVFGYYADKAAAEDVVSGSGLPWTTLRATQFHEFALAMAEGLTKLPVAPVFAGMSIQPVEVAEVAERLVDLAAGPPAGLVPDLAGPRAFGMDEMVRSYLLAKRRRRLLLPVRLPGAAARAMREGANLAPDRAVGRRTWEEFLAAEIVD